MGEPDPVLLQARTILGNWKQGDWTDEEVKDLVRQMVDRLDASRESIERILRLSLHIGYSLGWSDASNVPLETSKRDRSVENQLPKLLRYVQSGTVAAK